MLIYTIAGSKGGVIQQLFHFSISFCILYLGRRMVDPFLWQDLIYPISLVCEGSHSRCFLSWAEHVIYSTILAQRDRTSIRKPCFFRIENISQVQGSPTHYKRAFSEGCFICRGGSTFIFSGGSSLKKCLVVTKYLKIR